jgi:hypothetical protein
MPPLNAAQAAHRGAPPITRSQLRALVKRFVDEAIAPSLTHYAEADAPDYRRDALVSDASRWCIEAYFDSASASALRETSPNETHVGAGERRS